MKIKDVKDAVNQGNLKTATELALAEHRKEVDAKRDEEGNYTPDEGDRGHAGQQVEAAIAPEQIQREVDSGERAVVELGGYGVLPDVWTIKDIASHTQLLDNWIMVEHCAPPDRTKGGIVLPKNAAVKENLENQLYRVLAVGPGRIKNHETNERIPVRVNIGDLVVIRRTMAVAFCQEKRDYIIVPDNDVIAIVSGVSVRSDNEEVDAREDKAELEVANAELENAELEVVKED